MQKSAETTATRGARGSDRPPRVDAAPGSDPDGRAQANLFLISTY